MAPSRAPLHRFMSSPAQHLRSSPRLLSTSCRISCTRPSLCPHQPRIPALYSGPWIRLQTPSFLRSRPYSSSAAPNPPDYLNEKELYIFNKIRAELEPAKLEVQDISGGCGSMYALEIESPKFKGLSVIKQHKMVNEVLKEEIKSWHGVQLRTKAA